jgi:transglutaminase-like putative cysteine protease
VIYAVRHETTYLYEDPVTMSSHRLRLTPRETPRQRVRRFALDVTPETAALVAERDSFGNPSHLLDVRESHTRLSVVARSEVEVSADDRPLGFTPWEEAAEAARRPATPEALEAAEFAFPSRYAAADDAIEAFARASFAPGRPLLDAARDLMGRLHGAMAYDGGATDAFTPSADAFALRRGVCQDFAHVFLAACRSVGAPARYVSGYLLTRPPPGRERLVGADASHAWASVWCPVSGWVDFDPTNDLTPGLEHVAVAWGRDYGDVGPVVGVVLGGGAHKLEVSVDVAPVAGA